jgi:excisionase family DNA binding protein
MRTIISSKTAAEFLNVNESTVKRWADSGIIKCYRTAGGHRKFRLEDLQKHAVENDYQITDLMFVDKKSQSGNESINRIYRSLSSKLEKYILKGDSKEAYVLLYSMYYNKYSVADIFDRVVREAMTNIGLKWQDKTLDIATEHIATNTLLPALQKFEGVIYKKDKIKKTVICAGPESEYHEVGLLCVKLALESEGWNVIYPGINLPFKSISELINKIKPDMICISATYIRDIKSYEKELNKLIKVSELSGAKLLLGGGNNKIKKLNILKCESISDLIKYIQTI